MERLPAYLGKAVSNPVSNRSPWYKNTAPSYIGIFLWIAFYQSIAVGTLNHAGPVVCVIALVAAGLIGYAFYFYAPAMLGMKTGYPLYVVGSSTFGTRGGYIMPGLLMGVLQIGWFGVGIYYATTYILRAFGQVPHAGTLIFSVIALIWGLSTGYIGAKGIQYVSKASLILTIVPAIMVIYILVKTAPGIASYHPPAPDPFVAFTIIIQVVIGFFATAGAAGADFGMNNRDARDIKLSGLVGVAFGIVFAGGLPLLAVAGANGLHPGVGYTYDAAIRSIGGFGAGAMFLLFAIASIVPNCFSIFIAGNSFATMIPSVPRISSSMIAALISIVLAVTGVAANLAAVFSLIGASFGPICGAILADYILSGGKWAGPRKSFNWAGYAAWAVGFVIGIIPLIGPVPTWIKTADQPAAVYSMVAGFLIYFLVAKAGGEPEVLKLDPVTVQSNKVS